MMDTIAYTSGVRNANLLLGLVKMSSGIIPKATPLASRLGKRIRGTKGGLQQADTSLVAPSVLKEPPLQQYLSVMGKGTPMESGTSRAFRNELQSQIDPKSLGELQPAARMRSSTAPTDATVPPPRRNVAA